MELAHACSCSQPIHTQMNTHIYVYEPSSFSIYSIINQKHRVEETEGREINKNNKSKKMVVKGQCIPKMVKSKNYTKNNRNSLSSPVTLLERFRAVVLRLMMLSTLTSKSADHGGSGGGGGLDRGGQNKHGCYHLNEHHHSEAVEDCIEFIKQKANIIDRPISSHYYE